MNKKKELINITSDLLSEIPNNSLYLFKKLYEIKSLEKAEEEIYFEKQTIITAIRKLEKIIKNKILIIKNNNSSFTEFADELYQKLTLTLDNKLNLLSKENINIVFDERILLFKELIELFYKIISKFDILINIDFKQDKFILNEIMHGNYDFGMLIYNYSNIPKKNSKITILELGKINFFEISKKNSKNDKLIFNTYKTVNFKITKNMKENFDYKANKNKGSLSTSDYDLKVNFVKNELGKSVFIDKYSDFFDDSFYKKNYDTFEEGNYCLITKRKIEHNFILFFIDEIKKIFSKDII